MRGLAHLSLIVFISLSPAGAFAGNGCEPDLTPDPPASRQLIALVDRLQASGLTQDHKLILDGSAGALSPVEKRSYRFAPGTPPPPFAVERWSARELSGGTSPLLRITLAESRALQMELAIIPQGRRAALEDPSLSEVLWPGRRDHRLYKDELRRQMLAGDLQDALFLPRLNLRLSFSVPLDAAAVEFLRKGPSHNLALSRQQLADLMDKLGIFDAVNAVRSDFVSGAIGLSVVPARVRYDFGYNEATIVLTPELAVPLQFNELDVYTDYYRRIYDLIRARYPQLLAASSLDEGGESAPEAGDETPASLTFGDLTSWRYWRGLSERLLAGRPAEPVTAEPATTGPLSLHDAYLRRYMPLRLSKAQHHFALPTPLGEVVFDGFDHYTVSGTF
jgi:hypothetical protein